MMDDRLDDLLRDLAAGYHRPPETPREAMWQRIEAGRRARRERPTIVLRPWWRWGLGLAAILAVGIGIGRWSAGAPPVGEREPGEGGGGLAYRIAATQHLTRAEALLTAFRVEPAADARFATQAGELLATTRLMLDSPAGRDPVVRALLEELELVLVQIAQLPAGGRSPDEVALVIAGIEQRGVLTRLRTAVPAGPAPAQAQGAL